MALETKRLMLEFPTDSWEALRELVEITGTDKSARKEGDGSVKFIQDSLRNSEWIICQQSRRRTVTALSDSQLAILTKNGCVVEDDARLENYIKPGKEERAVAYFQKSK